MTALAPTLQAFFTDRLIRQRRASDHTIAAYRDTLRLLLTYAADHTDVPPSRLDIDDLDAPMIGAFLDHLEHDRGNTVRTRNARLAAIHSLFRFAALNHPEHAASISRVLAIPPKRGDQALVTYLTDPEVDALLAAPDPRTWTGRRDHALLLLDIQTGLRISELTGLSVADVHLGTGAHVSCHGKGRKDRITPLTKETVTTLRAWLAEHDSQPASAATPSNTASPSTPSPRPSDARASQPSESPPTSFATPPRCDYYMPASTPPSSHSGSATKASRRHGSTCSPTSTSKNARSPEPSNSVIHQADTTHPTT